MQKLVRWRHPAHDVVVSVPAHQVLESIYVEDRSKEAMSALVEFTFTHLKEHPDFISLVTNENLLRGRHIRKSKIIPAFTTP